MFCQLSLSFPAFCLHKRWRLICGMTKTRPWPLQGFWQAVSLMYSGDYFFVFTCDMGAMGSRSCHSHRYGNFHHCLLSHFFRKKNTLRLVRPANLFRKFREISVTGFSTFFIDIAMGILTILFNRQIMAYLGTNALSVYGVIVNISTFVQCCAYSVGRRLSRLSLPILVQEKESVFGRHCGMPLERQPFSALFGQYFALQSPTNLSIFLCRLQRKFCRLLRRLSGTTDCPSC